MSPYYVYKITNELNGMSYIGISRNVWKRIHTHFSGNTYPDSCFITKDAIFQFNFKLIEKCADEIHARAREDYWIAYFNSLYPTGYNLSTNHGSRITGYHILGRSIKEALGTKPLIWLQENTGIELGRLVDMLAGRRYFYSELALFAINEALRTDFKLPAEEDFSENTLYIEKNKKKDK